MYDLNYIINNSSYASNDQSEENTGRNLKMNGSKKDPGTFDFSLNNGVWLPGLDDVDNINIYSNFSEITNNQII